MQRSQTGLYSERAQLRPLPRHLHLRMGMTPSAMTILATDLPLSLFLTGKLTHFRSLQLLFRPFQINLSPLRRLQPRHPTLPLPIPAPIPIHTLTSHTKLSTLLHINRPPPPHLSPTTTTHRPCAPPPSMPSSCQLHHAQYIHLIHHLATTLLHIITPTAPITHPHTPSQLLLPQVLLHTLMYLPNSCPAVVCIALQ